MLPITLKVILFLLWPVPVYGDLWICRDVVSQRELFTSNPIASNSVTCLKQDMHKAAFNKVPADFFLNHKFAQTDQQTSGEKRGQLTASDIRPELGKNKMRTVWQHQETTIAQNAGAIGANNRGCLLSGKAFGNGAASAEITIRRGEATIDKIHIHFTNGSKSAPWKAILRGICRRPEVSIRPRT
jgi:hypothetical protein